MVQIGLVHRLMQVLAASKPIIFFLSSSLVKGTMSDYKNDCCHSRCSTFFAEPNIDRTEERAQLTGLYVSEDHRTGRTRSEMQNWAS
jgi:hypothetical protein